MKAASFAAAAALLATSLAMPAEARGRYGHHHHNHDDIDAGDVFAGVAIVGGIAAFASAITQGNRAKQDAAVGACAEEAEFRGHGGLTEITHVSKRKGYYTVQGLLGMEPGVSAGFTCTVRNGRIYSLRLSGDGV